MISVTFLPLNKKTLINEGESILKAASNLGIDINGVCAGNGTCGKCKILVTKGNNQTIRKEESIHLLESELKSGFRLGCQFCPTEETCVLLLNTWKKEIEKEVIEYKTLPKGEIGVVFDIGTTTVEMAAYDLSSKEKILEICKENPQKIGGMDVISRIMYCQKGKKNVYQMQNLIYRCINELLGELFLNFRENKEIIKQKLTKMMVLGNTTMSHLFLGKSVEGLAKAPFYQAFRGSVSFTNEKTPFEISQNGVITLLPNISGYVGSDTLGCMYAVDLEHQRGVQFILDIGTNAEMVLYDNGKMECCSVAAGPAFEGASIFQGMKAVSGAIKGVKRKEGKLILDVVENQIPKGICGSGMIDFLAVMLDLGEIDKTGRMIGKEELVLYKGEKKVVLTQKDIRQIQLAKASIYAGIYTLLNRNHIDIIEIDKFYLAGTFGNNVNLENAKKIGLIPDVISDKIELIGNGALDGGGKILIHEISNTSIEENLKKVTHVELAEEEAFMNLFIKSINF